MLIGYIEQEILEGRFWYFWLHSCTNEFEPIDLQPDDQEQFDPADPPVQSAQSSSHLSDHLPD